MILLYIYIFIAICLGVAYSVYYWRYEYKEPANITLKPWHLVIFKILLLIIASLLAPMSAYELINKPRKEA